MRYVVVAIALALPSVAGAQRSNLNQVLRAATSAQHAVQRSSSGCQTATRSNLVSLKAQVRALFTGGTPQTLQSTKLFAAGLVLGASMAGCPARVKQLITRASTILNAAHLPTAETAALDVAPHHSRRPQDRRYRRALRRLQDAADGLATARRQCRRAVSGNLRRSTRDVRDLMNGTGRARLSQSTLFLAGVVLAAGLSRCPKAVTADLQSAYKALYRMGRHTVVKRHVRAAQQAVMDARDALLDAPRRCRRAVSSNARRLARDLKDLQRGRRVSIPDLQTFSVGVVLAAKLARCPRAVTSDLRHAARDIVKLSR